VFFAQALTAVWFLLCDPRLEDAAQRYVPIEARRHGCASALFGRLLYWDVAIGVAASGVALLGTLMAWLLGAASDDLALMLTLAIVSNGAASSTGSAGAAFALTDRLQALGPIRLKCAVLLSAFSLGGLLAGGPEGYLGGQALGAVVTSIVLARVSLRVVRAEFGPPVSRVPLPAGLLRFSLKASAGTSVAAATDSGVLALAGLLGDPALVTVLKIASAPSRLYTSVVSPVASMLYPRLAEAAAAGERARIVRDAARSSLLLSALGAAALLIAAPLAGHVLGLAYGASYAQAGPAAVLLLGVACVKGSVSWSKVLPLAVGKPEWRLTFLATEGLLLLGLLLVAAWAAPGAMPTAIAFACGSLALAVLGSAFWIFFSLRRLVICDD
jgi:O-antigen/teichoic acid export membrane protein